MTHHAARASKTRKRRKVEQNVVVRRRRRTEAGLMVEVRKVQMAVNHLMQHCRGSERGRKHIDWVTTHWLL